MRAPSIGTALRLGRIAALVAACLIFLHACDRTRRLVPTDVWLELAAAGVLGAVAMIAAWFEIVRAERIEEAEELEANDPPAPRAGDFLYDTGTHAIRARIAGSGNLVVHGREHRGLGHEWSWTFRADTFPAVRTVLGGDGEDDVLDLLEEVVPELDSDSRADPGAWLRAHGIAGTYREKGDHPSRTTHKLPILRPGLRRATESARTRRSRAQDEQAQDPDTSRPAHRTGSPARSATTEAPDARSGPMRRADTDRAGYTPRRSGTAGPGSGPLPAARTSRTDRATPEARSPAHSGPLPASRSTTDSGPAPGTARRANSARGSTAGQTAGASKRRTSESPRGSGRVRESGPAPTPGSGLPSRRGRRPEDEFTDDASRPDPTYRARPRPRAGDLPGTPLHGSRRPYDAEPPAPGLFSARTGIDQDESPPPASGRSRYRSAGAEPVNARPPSRFEVYPDDSAYQDEAASSDQAVYLDNTAYSDPAAYPNHAVHRDYSGADYDEPDSASPDQPRRRGHRYR